MNLERIKYLCEEKRYPRGLTGLAADIDMSVANLHRCIKEGSMQMGAIEKIARCLHVPVSVFFDDDVSDGAFKGSVGGLNTRCSESSVKRSDYDELRGRVHKLEKTVSLFAGAIRKLNAQIEAPVDGLFNS